MPKPATYDQIIDAPEGQEFQTVTGKIKKIFDRNTGTGEYGAWSFQNCAFLIGGKELVITLKNREAMEKSMEGLMVDIIAGSKGHGIKTKDNVYKGKKSRTLSITASATITRSGTAAPEQEESESTPPSKESNTTPADGVHPVVQAKKNVRKLANLLILCTQEAAVIMKAMEEDLGESVDMDEFFRSASISLFIASERRKYDELMPSGRVLESEAVRQQNAKETEAAKEEKPEPRKPIDPDAPLPEATHDEEGNPY